MSWALRAFSEAVLKSRFAGRSSNEVVTKSSWFTLREGAMPHTPANTFCKKLNQLGVWVELFCLTGRSGELLNADACPFMQKPRIFNEGH